jgi:hypothetical protein
VGSESDIELVAVSYKFDFSERRNLPNKDMDPDQKLPKSFRGPPSLVHFLFPLLTLSVEIHKGHRLSLVVYSPNPSSSSVAGSFPLLPYNLFPLACLSSRPPPNPQCLTIPPSVVTYRRPPDLPPEKSPRNPGRPKLKVLCAPSLAATPVG